MSQAHEHATTGRRTLTVSVVTPEGAVFEGPAAHVVVPGIEGEVAFYPLHAAYVGALGTGEMRIALPDGRVERWVLEGGVAEVAEEAVTVLADRVQRIERIDVASVRAELARATASVPEDEPAEAERDRVIRTAQVKLRLASRGALT